MAPVALAQTGGTPAETALVPVLPEKHVMVRQHAQRETPPEVRTGGPIT